MDKKYINKVAPSHDRTSCSDDFPTNARYAADDFGGCYRCTLIAAAKPSSIEATPIKTRKRNARS